jgi:hypothetical protein
LFSKKIHNFVSIIKQKNAIMELSLDMNKRYTYADYLTWLDDKSRELIHGFIKMMLPASRIEHAKVSKNISWYLESICQKK